MKKLKKPKDRDVVTFVISPDARKLINAAMKATGQNQTDLINHALTLNITDVVDALKNEREAGLVEFVETLRSMKRPQGDKPLSE